MSDLKQLFQMSRRERRGTIVLLALMAMLITVSFVIGSRKEHVPQADNVDKLELFDAQTDTVKYTVEKNVREKSGKKRHATKRRAPKKSKPSSDKPRRLDPVPQF